MISHLTEERGDGPDEPGFSAVGIVVDEEGRIALALTAPDDEVTDYWHLNQIEARNLAKMIFAILGEA